ncbi:inorganic phosphate transporter [Mycobacterium sp. CBMA293]|uniref:inorganic phosphate transporter n=1 Tax=unclassified Mycolicibacterium TaxID=2636767 RepID=UPI0012DF1196|nr:MULTISPECIES: inorganic phosphate transporter [unclassified Mycolicibacterium]MUL44646.1 inorganic phosphate transporter [Mycolicibacterium sp. CBMA 360]MUL59970.1 inorganic phosphate transporter [Mycolicibacterium sp. CBMA 335]MUL68813.1 inorganic phosphate transporter [Mycolicibacterium sp. CBMA 311]MUL93796.1 inorganic phosphate transporter [Mycolicibacterium sp. CBMA 230]MUM06039.1 anion permease [Mycolicibacterium sp. CBMA 213]
MSETIVILALLVATALAFDFTNGFHDTGNAMATSIATGALKPKAAVTLSGILNLVGAFLSVNVAVTVATNVLKIQDPKTGHLKLDATVALTVIFSGLVGGILWNLLTWLFGIPSSSSHALFGGLIGSGIAAAGFAGVNWDGLTSKVLIPAVASPFIAGVIAMTGTWLVYRISKNVTKKRREEGFRWGQIATASLLSLAHGTGDAQKTMGVIALALISTGHLTGDVKKDGLPFWIIASCALAIGLGTYIGGWRVIRTLGKGLVEIESPQGFSAESASAAVILTSSVAGMALSTTHVATGSILGSGIGKPGGEVRWKVAGRMAAAWLITLPAAGLVGALSFLLANGIASASSHLVGDIVIFVILVALSGFMYWRAQQQKIDQNNVNADWDETTNSTVPADVRAASKSDTASV